MFPDATASILKDQRKGDFLATAYRDGSADTPLATAFKDAWANQLRAEYKLKLFHGQDFKNGSLDFSSCVHRVFWKDNVPAILLTDLSKPLLNLFIVCVHVYPFACSWIGSFARSFVRSLVRSLLNWC